ncbi:MAG: outer membrane beta-barrel protein [Bacteroidota bacterium]
MVKKVLIIGLFILFVTSASGQQHFWGVQFGVASTNIDDDKLILSDDQLVESRRTGLNAGLTYQYRVAKRFQLGFDILYAEKGENYELIPPDFDPDDVFRFMWNYQYISMPIKCGFSLGERFAGFTNVGIVPSWLLYGEFMMTSNTILTNPENITREGNRFDLSGLLELGVRYQINKRYVIYGQAAYQRSFTNINFGADWFEEGEYHEGIIFSLGMRRSFK